MAADRIITRRRLLQTTAALGTGVAFAGLPLGSARAATLSIGFIYVGPRDDFGYNQSHAVGAAAVKKMTDVKVLEEENVPETVAVQKTMESMIELDGATLLFPTSFGYYDPHVLKLARQFPKVRFEHCGGLWSDKDPKNAASYFGYIDECCHVSGIVAGHSTKSGKLGFIAAKPIPQVLRNINAFALGARLANPKATVQVIFTGDWSLPTKEAEGTNGLVDQGIDVVTCHVDSPKVVVETAEKRGAMVCGYHADQSKLAPKGYLTGAEWNWEELYPKFVTMHMKGETIPNLVRGGLKEKIVKQGAYTALVSEAARKQADDVKGKLTAGNYVIFKGPITDNKGKVVIAAGVGRGQTDIVLEQMDYLVEGVVGATSERAMSVQVANADGKEDAASRAAASSRLVSRESIEAVLVPAVAFVGSLVAFGIFIAAYGVDPLSLYELMYRGAFGTWFSWQNTLVRAAPLLLTALCTALPAQLGMVVIGGEGAFVIGGLAAAAVALPVHALPPIGVDCVMALAAMLIGGLWIMAVGALRQYRGVNETISSLLMVYIAVALMNHLVEGPLRDPASLNKPSTPPIGAANMIGNIPGTEVHWGLVLGIAACVLAYILMQHTVFGFSARIVGGNARAARIVGLPIGRLVLVTTFLAGAAPGLAGMFEVAAVQGQANANINAGYGLTGILVSFLARHNPLAIIPVAILLGGIGASGGLLQRRLDLPDATVLVLQGFIFVCLLASEALYGRIPIPFMRRR